MDDYDLTQLTKTDQGAFKMLIPLRYIPHYLLDSYEPFSSKIVQTFLSEKDTFVDIGTHLGYYSLLALSSQPDIKVIGFEPVEINFEITKKNLQLNKLKNFQIYNFAASNKQGHRKFFLTEAAGECGFYNNHLAPVIKNIEVETIIPDDLLQEQKVSFLKIDVEGHEIKVLKGLKKTIAKNKNLRLLIEYNPNALKNSKFSGDGLLKVLTALGFLIYFVDEKEERLVLYNKKLKNWINLAQTQYTNLFCIRIHDSKKDIIKEEKDQNGNLSYFITKKIKYKDNKKNEPLPAASSGVSHKSGTSSFERSSSRSKLRGILAQNKINLVAELSFYKTLHLLRNAPGAPEQVFSRLQGTEKELIKIKSSKLWKILYLYKNPHRVFSYYSKRIINRIFLKKVENFEINLSPGKPNQDKLHLGCGKVILDGWLNIDLNNNLDKRIYPLDLSHTFPFKDDQTSKIFTEHIIECFSKEISLRFLSECYRVLKPGGVIRIGFSDFTKLLKAYYKKDNSYKRKMLTDMKLLKTDTWDEFIADMLFSWDRRYYYTCNLLKKFLQITGFRNIEVRKFNESKYGFAEDTRKLPDNTYLEAKKSN